MKQLLKIILLLNSLLFLITTNANEILYSDSGKTSIVLLDNTFKETIIERELVRSIIVEWQTNYKTSKEIYIVVSKNCNNTYAEYYSINLEDNLKREYKNIYVKGGSRLGDGIFEYICSFNSTNDTPNKLNNNDYNYYVKYNEYNTMLVATTEPCNNQEYFNKGYEYNFYSAIPIKRLKRNSDAHFTINNYAFTVKGCWSGTNHKLVWVRKHDNKIGYDDNFYITDFTKQ